MLKQLRIRKLFGRFDYEVCFMPGGVSILTGPNGYGKSTILHILNSISNKRIYELLEFEFRSIELIFEENLHSGITLKKSFGIKRQGTTFFINGVKVTPAIIKKLKNNEKYCRDHDKYSWKKARQLSLFENEELLEKYLNTNLDVGDDLLEYFEGEAHKEKKDESELYRTIDSLSNACGKTRLISDQRLLKLSNINGEEGILDAISRLPQSLKDIIERVSSEYSVKANELDSTYPKRLLSSQQGITKKEYIERFVTAQVKFKKLNEYKLANISLLEGGVYDKRFADALKIYFDDFFSKYQVFENLISQLELFTFVINNRLKFKHIEISKEKGFVIIDETQGRVLELKKLSSGEKQEILLFFDLIFNTENYEVLLIDEPELSLHISWQQQFMDDLLKVTKMNNLQVVIATHSPQIIGKHWDIQIDLGELYNGD